MRDLFAMRVWSCDVDNGDNVKHVAGKKAIERFRHKGVALMPNPRVNLERTWHVTTFLSTPPLLCPLLLQTALLQDRTPEQLPALQIAIIASLCHAIPPSHTAPLMPRTCSRKGETRRNPASVCTTRTPAYP